MKIDVSFSNINIRFISIKNCFEQNEKILIGMNEIVVKMNLAVQFSMECANNS